MSEKMKTARFKNISARLIDHIVPGEIKEVPEYRVHAEDLADLDERDRAIVAGAQLHGSPLGMLTGESLRRSAPVKAGLVFEIKDGGDGPPMPTPSVLDLANVPLEKALRLIAVEKDVAVLMQWEDDPRPEVRSALEKRAAEL